MMKTENQKDPIQLKGILIIIAIVFTLLAIIIYTYEYIHSRVKLNDLLYVSMFAQIAIFSGVLLIVTKNIWVKMFLVTNLFSFVFIIINYAYTFIYGSKLFISMIVPIELGFIIGLSLIIFYFLKKVWNHYLSR